MTIKKYFYINISIAFMLCFFNLNLSAQIKYLQYEVDFTILDTAIYEITYNVEIVTDTLNLNWIKS